MEILNRDVMDVIRNNQLIPLNLGICINYIVIVYLVLFYQHHNTFILLELFLLHNSWNFFGWYKSIQSQMYLFQVTY